jgi:D-lactate dehydrogenase
MKSSKIVFFEVEEMDEKQILTTFPNAKIEPKVLSENEIIKKYKDTEILCPFIYTKITKKVIQNLPNLKLIITRSVGYDHIDLKAAKERGIPVCNVPDYGSHVIAEHVFALLLSTIRCVKEGDEKVERCEFDFHGLRGVALKGKTLGLIGTGKIGKNVARIASLGFLMDVVAFDINQDTEAARENHFAYVDQIDEVFEKSDIISLHVPFLPSTKHLINKKTIQKMRNGVILINTARGGIIETKAFVKALKSKKISYAALDVLEHEKNIAENSELIHLPNVVVTPHIAFYADDSMHKMYLESILSIERFIKNEELIHQVVGE